MNDQQRMTEQQFRKQTKERGNFIHAGRERDFKKERILIEDTEDCEYDCDEEECLATGCPRYGKCIFTKDK